MTTAQIQKEIRFLQLCLKYTDRAIKNPPNDDVSKIMIEQSLRIDAELAKFERMLSKQRKKRRKR